MKIVNLGWGHGLRNRTTAQQAEDPKLNPSAARRRTRRQREGHLCWLQQRLLRSWARWPLRIDPWTVPWSQQWPWKIIPMVRGGVRSFEFRRKLSKCSQWQLLTFAAKAGVERRKWAGEGCQSPGGLGLVPWTLKHVYVLRGWSNRKGRITGATSVSRQREVGFGAQCGGWP